MHFGGQVVSHLRTLKDMGHSSSNLRFPEKNNCTMQYAVEIL